MGILPVNKDGYIGHAPYVVIGLVIVNGLVLAATYLFASPQLVFSGYGFIPVHPSILTVFSSLFLHVGIFHYVGNMFFLSMFGYRIENAFGRWLFVLVFLTCGCGATGLYYLFNQASSMPCVGASGAISGIMGCYLVLFPDSRFDIDVFFWGSDLRTIPTQATGAVGAWVAEQILLGLLTRTVQFSSTAFSAHIGGFITGVATTLVLVSIFPKIRTRGEQPFVVRYLKGTVHDMNGEPLSNARFEMRSDSGEPIATTTGSKGRFDIGRVPDGWYSFTVSKDGWPTVRGNIVVRRDMRHNVPVEIRMSQQRSDGIVTTEQGGLQSG